MILTKPSTRIKNVRSVNLINLLKVPYINVALAN